MKAARFNGKQVFQIVCRDSGLPRPVAELRFHPKRRWKFDFAWPEQKVALEVEGGVWVGGRHTSGAGFVKDMEKYNEATCAGWRLLRVQPKDLLTMNTVGLLRRALLSQ